MTYKAIRITNNPNARSYANCGYSMLVAIGELTLNRRLLAC